MKQLCALYVGLVTLGLLWCGPPIEPPPSPPPSTTTAVPEAAEAEDYTTKERAGDLIIDSEGGCWGEGLAFDMCIARQILIWDGARNPQYACEQCIAELPGPWPLGGAETCAFANAGFLLHEELGGFLSRLMQTNRRCPHDPRFCGRTEVRKDRFAEFRSRLDPHMNMAGRLNGIRAWCEKLRAAVRT